MEKVILTTGGTGGHIFPALAVAEELRRRFPKIELVFMGSTHGPEASLARKNQIQFEGLDVHGFLGRGIRATAAAMKMLAAIWRAGRFIKNFRPDAIAGFGGYAAFAPMLAGHFLGVPLLLHEQNAIAGTGNRVLSKMATRICVSLPNTEGFTGSVRLTGNPVRKAIAEMKAADRTVHNPPRLLILGGSQGAHGINELIKALLPAFRKRAWEIVHQCGKTDLKDLQDAYAQNGYSPDCARAFIEDMAGTYGWADLAICRAGASTVSELCVAALPSILIPFPAAIHDHQTLNAQNMVAGGSALLFQQKDLEPGLLLETLDRLFNEHDRLEKMAMSARGLAIADAAGRLADQLSEMCRESK